MAIVVVVIMVVMVAQRCRRDAGRAWWGSEATMTAACSQRDWQQRRWREPNTTNTVIAVIAIVDGSGSGGGRR